MADGADGLAEGAAGEDAAFERPGTARTGTTRTGTVLPGAGLDDELDIGPLSPRAEAWGRRSEPLTVMITVIPAATATATNTATGATTPGCRQTRRHHRGPAGTIALGNPAGPNAPAAMRHAHPARPPGR